MGRPAKLPKVLSRKECSSVLGLLDRDEFYGHRNLCLVRLMLETGLRVGEAVALRPEHLNLDAGRLIVREGKGARDRVLWINDELCALIDAWIERRPESRWLICTRRGTKVSPRYVRRLVKRLAREAGVQEAARVSPHTLRHTFATLLYKDTRDLRLVQKALGHADISTTQIYTHLVDDELEEALRAFQASRAAPPVGGHA